MNIYHNKIYGSPVVLAIVCTCTCMHMYQYMLGLLTFISDDKNAKSVSFFNIAGIIVGVVNTASASTIISTAIINF